MKARDRLEPHFMPAPKRTHLNLIVRAAVSLILIGGLVYHIGSGAIISQMRTVPWQTLVLVIALLAGHVLIITPRWANILRALGYPLSSFALIGSVFLGFLFNQLLPTAVGGDVIRAWRAQQLGVPWDVSIHSVLFDRASAILVVAIAILMLLPFVDPPAVDAAIMGMTGLAVMVGLAALLGAGVFVCVRLVPRVLDMLLRVGVGLKRSVSNLIGQPRLLSFICVLAALNQLLVLIAIWLLARALHVEIRFIDFAVVIFIATIASAIPISIAGWGLREGVLVYLLGTYDVAPDTAMAVSILFGVCLTLASAPAVFVVLRRSTPPRPGGEEARSNAEGPLSLSGR